MNQLTDIPPVRVFYGRNRPSTYRELLIDLPSGRDSIVELHHEITTVNNPVGMLLLIGTESSKDASNTAPSRSAVSGVSGPGPVASTGRNEGC